MWPINISSVVEEKLVADSLAVTKFCTYHQVLLELNEKDSMDKMSFSHNFGQRGVFVWHTVMQPMTLPIFLLIFMSTKFALLFRLPDILTVLVMACMHVHSVITSSITYLTMCTRI